MEKQRKIYQTIKVIGIGSCWCRNVDLIDKLYDVDEYILLDTDIKSLQKNINDTKLYMPFVRRISGRLIGEKSFEGLGVNTYKQGEQAATESKKSIMEALQGIDIVFIMAGLGGCTGTSVTPIVASYAKNIGANIIGVVTMPFSFEGEKRRNVAIESVKKLRQYTNNVVLFENEDILKEDLSVKVSEALKLRYADYSEKFREVFKKMNIAMV